MQTGLLFKHIINSLVSGKKKIHLSKVVIITVVDNYQSCLTQAITSLILKFIDNISPLEGQKMQMTKVKGQR